MADAQALFKDHAGNIFGYLCRYTLNHVEAEDLLSDVFVRLIEQFERMRDREFDWKPWLYECVLDGELGAKLSAIAKDPAVMDRLSGGDAVKFKALVKQREDELKNLRADYEKYLQAMDQAAKQYESVNERIAGHVKDEKAMYGERDQSYDNAYDLSSNFSDEVGRVSGKLDDISAEILKSPVLMNK